MHLYGRAADFIVDADGDGLQDDLNNDGRIDLEDIKAVREIADEIDRESEPGANSLLGGFGMYPRHDIKMREKQTPYAHVDVRGYLGDDGAPIRWQMD